MRSVEQLRQDFGPNFEVIENGLSMIDSADFHRLFAADKRDWGQIADAFVNIKEWKRLTNPNEVACTTAAAVIKSMVSTSTLPVIEVLNHNADVEWARTVVLSAKAAFIKKRGDNPYMVSDILFQAESCLNKSSANFELKHKTLETIEFVMNQ
jgi:hypothetical protein